LYTQLFYSTETVHDLFMQEALGLARQAAASGEVPVGAIVVIEGQVAGRGANSPIAKNDPTAHAEMLALREAAQAVGNYRLAEATLYVTLEPCVMCAGALVAARVKRLVFGTRDLRFGGVRSKFRIADSELLNHRVEIVEGVPELLRRTALTTGSLMTVRPRTDIEHAEMPAIPPKTWCLFARAAISGQCARPAGCGSL
jgi:tRNA(adenine34) deaminase